MAGVGFEGGIDLMDSSSVKVSGERSRRRTPASRRQPIQSCWENNSFGLDLLRGVGWS